MHREPEGRIRWKDSPDTEEIRLHLFEVIRNPAEHVHKGYVFYTRPAFAIALEQLVEWKDERVVTALEELAEQPEMEGARTNVMDIKKSVMRMLED